jgi:hypothetical protein
MNPTIQNPPAALLAIRKLADEIRLGITSSANRFRCFDSDRIGIVEQSHLIDVSCVVDAMTSEADPATSFQILTGLKQVLKLYLAVHTEGTTNEIETGLHLAWHRAEYLQAPELLALESAVGKSLQRAANVSSYIERNFENVHRRDGLVLASLATGACVVSISYVGENQHPRRSADFVDLGRDFGSFPGTEEDEQSSVLVFNDIDDVYRRTSGLYRDMLKLKDQAEFVNLRSDNAAGKYIVFIDEISADNNADGIEDERFAGISPVRARDLFYGRRRKTLSPNVFLMWNGEAVLTTECDKIYGGSPPIPENDDDVAEYQQTISPVRAAALFMGRNAFLKKHRRHFFRGKRPLSIED